MISQGKITLISIEKVFVYLVVIDSLHLRVFFISNRNCTLKIVFFFLVHVLLKATSKREWYDEGNLFETNDFKLYENFEEFCDCEIRKSAYFV